MSRRATSRHRARGGRVLDRDQFITYARVQVDTATSLLAGHGPSPGGCACGRPWPCPQRESLSAVAEHYQSRLALLDETVLLPVITPVAIPAVAESARRTLGGLLRLAYRRMCA
ncbi:hypothetical protein [Catellatospora vulcania]|uniref:hypothetical protein n=1 Tax=Catellatospora vulcania TaxID=1460450 RepID=UPI0012D473E8|nr:hypothetical protein [Catellatospora vulcania]